MTAKTFKLISRTSATLLILLIFSLCAYACYDGMTRDICRHLDRYTQAEQTAMNLSLWACQKYY